MKCAYDAVSGGLNPKISPHLNGADWAEALVAYGNTYLHTCAESDWASVGLKKKLLKRHFFAFGVEIYDSAPAIQATF